MPLVHDQLAAAGAGPPVDRAKAIAGDEGACIGELETVGAHASDEVTGRELGVERGHEAPQELGAGVDLQSVRAVDPTLPDEHPDPAARPHANLARARPSPSGRSGAGASTVRSSPAPSVTLNGLSPSTTATPRGMIRWSSSRSIRVLRGELDLRDDLVALERSVAVDRQPRPQLGRLLEEEPGGDDQRERRRDDDELRPPERERGDQAEGGEADVRGEPRRGERRHVLG